MSDPYDSTRRHLRLPRRVPVRISTIDPETDPRTGKVYFRSTSEICRNLSRGGVFIPTEDPPAPGRRLLVEIHVPNREPIEAIGRVAWSKKVLGSTGAAGAADDVSGVGIEFIGAEMALEALDRLGEE